MQSFNDSMSSFSVEERIKLQFDNDHDADKHILNIFSHKSSSFQKLVLCESLEFYLPHRISAIDIQANFVKFYWKLERTLTDDKREFKATTLHSIALTYIKCFTKTAETNSMGSKAIILK